MPSPLRYEPSVESVLADLLPPGCRVSGDRAGLRRRVTWPVLARATGLGEIEGGELVLVPAPRAPEVVPRLSGLDRAGVSAVVFESPAPSAPGVRVPVIELPEGESARSWQTAIERYIARRRRDLFALDHEMHRTAVDRAIGGESLPAILQAVREATGAGVAVDRHGDITSAGVDPNSLSHETLLRARIAVQESDLEPRELGVEPPVLVLPIVAGRERRGVALLVGGPENPDDRAVIMASLAEASAIALARETDPPLPSLDALLSLERLPGVRDIGTPALALAFESEGLESRQVERAARLEFGGRDIPAVLVEYGGRVVALLHDQRAIPWETVHAGMRQRLGSEDLRMGAGSAVSAEAELRRSVEEAVEALALGEDSVVGYPAVELISLLRKDVGWDRYARARLEPLLRDRESGGELYETLRCYLHSGRNARAAAQRLSVHRNTLLYRLRRIEDLLDIDLAVPSTAFEIEVAVAAIEARER